MKTATTPKQISKPASMSDVDSMMQHLTKLTIVANEHQMRIDAARACITESEKAIDDCRKQITDLRPKVNGVFAPFNVSI